MLADSGLNFHKKLMKFEYLQLYFHDSKFSREFHKNSATKNSDYMVHDFPYPPAISIQ